MMAATCRVPNVTRVCPVNKKNSKTQRTVQSACSRRFSWESDLKTPSDKGMENNDAANATLQADLDIADHKLACEKTLADHKLSRGESSWQPKGTALVEHTYSIAEATADWTLTCDMARAEHNRSSGGSREAYRVATSKAKADYRLACSMASIDREHSKEQLSRRQRRNETCVIFLPLVFSVVFYVVGRAMS